MDIREYFQKEQKGFYRILCNSMTVERRKQFYNAINEWHESEVKKLNIFSVTNSTLRKCCDNPDVNEMESQNTDCDGDYEICTITYCKNCKQTLKIEP